MSARPCSVYSRARSRPNGAKSALQLRLPARTGSRRRCSMSGAMARRRKINTRVGRRAARERVRELVSQHDDQVVLLIWGGRVLGWSLRRIAAALEGSIVLPWPPRWIYGRERWTAGDRPADLPPPRHSHGSAAPPPRGLPRLSQRKSRPQPVEAEGKCKTSEGEEDPAGLVRVAHPSRSEAAYRSRGRPRPRGRDPAESRRQRLAGGVQPGRRTATRRGGVHG